MADSSLFIAAQRLRVDSIFSSDMDDIAKTRARLATQLVFFASGFTGSSWAPLIPFAKERLSADAKTMGGLLLCSGIGAVASMTFVGSVCAKVGSKPVIIAAAIAAVCDLPLLAVAPTKVLLAIPLVLFGICSGSINVAMNIHAVEVERLINTPLMSGFHGIFSIGAFMGSAFVSFILSMAIAPVIATLLSATIVVIVLAVAAPRLLGNTGEKSEPGPTFAVPHGIVLLMAALAFVLFLVEGAMLDWGALLLIERNILETNKAGFAYMIFSITMTIGRLCGDKVVTKVGDTRSLVCGSIIALIGFLLVLLPNFYIIVLSGFGVIGMGLSNVVPIIFSLAGKQNVMPSGLAVAAVTGVGYLGILAGPAGIGFVASATSLNDSFWMLAGLLCFVPLCGKFVVDRALRSVPRSDEGENEFELEEEEVNRVKSDDFEV